MLRLPFVLISATIIWLSRFSWAYFSLEVGDPCPTIQYRSSCQPAEKCERLRQYILSGRLTPQTVMGCGFTSYGEKICCPLDEADTLLRFDAQTSSSPRTTTTTTTSTTTEPPGWFDIFNTKRDYVQRSVASTLPTPKGSITFPDTSPGAECRAPLYEGKCLAVSQCPSVEPLLEQGRLRDEDFQTCRDGIMEEIICCPMNLPLQPRGQEPSVVSSRSGYQSEATTVDPKVNELDKAATARAVELLPHYNHLAALAYPNAAFDGHIHECTALALTQDLLLSAAGCERPSHAVFGVADLRDVDVDEDYLVDIVRLAHHRNDLSLMRLQKPLSLGADTNSNVSLAPICTQFELTRLQVSGKLVAVGWAKGKDSDCPLYELPMRLLPTSACADLTNLGNVQGLLASHLCVEPRDMNDLHRFSSASTCAPCPAVVSSILHLIRPNGSRCVLGLATPTGADCEASAMYYTNILNASFTHFVEQQQQREKQQQQL